MKKIRNKLIAVVSLVILLAALIISLRHADNQKLKANIVRHAVTSLINDIPVVMLEGKTPLYDSTSVQANGRLYFINDIGIDDSVFIELGLKPIPSGRKPNVDAGDVIIVFTFHELFTRKTVDEIQFSYTFGNLGAQCFEIQAQRKEGKISFTYRHKWVS